MTIIGAKRNHPLGGQALQLSKSIASTKMVSEGARSQLAMSRCAADHLGYAITWVDQYRIRIALAADDLVCLRAAIEMTCDHAMQARFP